MEEQIAKLIFEKLGYMPALSHFSDAKTHAAIEIYSLDIAKIADHLMALNRKAEPPAFLKETK